MLEIMLKSSCVHHPGFGLFLLLLNLSKRTVTSVSGVLAQLTGECHLLLLPLGSSEDVDVEAAVGPVSRLSRLIRLKEC